MASRADKKAESERRARVLYARLMAVKPDDLSERAWTIKAGVSSSFFTNMQSKGSEPSIGNLRLVLEAIGLTLPEFLAHEAEGRMYAAPNAQELISALHAVLPGLPIPSRKKDTRAEYLAATVLDALRLPHGMRANPANLNGNEPDDPEEAAPTRATTK